MNTSLRRCSRPALIERTNSDDLNDLYMGRGVVESSTTIMTHATNGKRTRRTTKKKRDPPGHGIIRKSNNRPTSSSSIASARSCPVVLVNNTTRNMLLPTMEKHEASSSTLSTLNSDGESDNNSDYTMNNSSHNNKITWEHSWLKDDSLTRTSVYYRRLNRPVSRIQAAARGMMARTHYRDARLAMIQHEILQIQHFCARRIQALVRGWMTRMKQKMVRLEEQLVRIHAGHERDLRRIEQNKKLEMRRVMGQSKIITGKENKRQSKALESVTEDIYAMRRENRELRNQNDTLQKATFIMAKKNERTMEMTSIINNNLKQLKASVPQFERDHEQISNVSLEYLQRRARYEEALEMRKEHMCFEKKVTKCLIQSIDNILKHIDDRCHDVALKRSILDQARETLKTVRTKKGGGISTTASY